MTKLEIGSWSRLAVPLVVALVSPSPARAQAQAGQIVVVSQPPGAVVSVDGQMRGKATITVDHLAPGDHYVEARWPDGSGSASAIAKVTAGGSYVVQIHPGMTPSTEAPPPPAPAAPPQYVPPSYPAPSYPPASGAPPPSYGGAMYVPPSRSSHAPPRGLVELITGASLMVVGLVIGASSVPFWTDCHVDMDGFRVCPTVGESYFTLSNRVGPDEATVMQSDANTALGLTIVGGTMFIGGTALLAVGVTRFSRWRRWRAGHTAAASEPRLVAYPLIAPGTAGVGARFAF